MNHTGMLHLSQFCDHIGDLVWRRGWWYNPVRLHYKFAVSYLFNQALTRGSHGHCLQSFICVTTCSKIEPSRVELVSRYSGVHRQRHRKEILWVVQSLPRFYLLLPSSNRCGRRGCICNEVILETSSKIIRTVCIIQALLHSDVSSPASVPIVMVDR